MSSRKFGGNVHSQIENGLFLEPVNEMIEKNPRNIAFISAAVLAGYIALIGGVAYFSDSTQTEKNTPVSTDK